MSDALLKAAFGRTTRRYSSCRKESDSVPAGLLLHPHTLVLIRVLQNAVLALYWLPALLYETMQNLAIIYGAVIDDVLSKVRSDFVQEGNE